jgi:copper homeostasis protein
MINQKTTIVEMKKEIKIEVCANSFESALAASEGGAGRVELCSAMLEGGLTPSYATIEMVKQKIDIKLNVIIRPRGGDFCYSASEFEVMKRDIEIAKEIGSNAVVFGILLPDGRIDVARTRELVQIASPMEVTFHRAFDMCNDLFVALEELKKLKIQRILTSGGKQTALLGISTLAELVKRAGSEIIIMPGSGVKPENIVDLINGTGAREFHLSGTIRTESQMKYRNPEINMGGVAGVPEYEISVTSAKIIKEVTDICKLF